MISKIWRVSENQSHNSHPQSVCFNQKLRRTGKVTLHLLGGAEARCPVPFFYSLPANYIFDELRTKEKAQKRSLTRGRREGLEKGRWFISKPFVLDNQARPPRRKICVYGGHLHLEASSKRELKSGDVSDFTSRPRKMLQEFFTFLPSSTFTRLYPACSSYHLRPRLLQSRELASRHFLGISECSVPCYLWLETIVKSFPCYYPTTQKTKQNSSSSNTKTPQNKVKQSKRTGIQQKFKELNEYDSSADDTE